jgi:hypothetical protein
LPDDKIRAVVDFVEFLRHQQQRSATSLDERLRAAVEAGVITPPVPSVQRSSVRDLPPAWLPGKPGSEMVIEDKLPLQTLNTTFGVGDNLVGASQKMSAGLSRNDWKFD